MKRIYSDIDAEEEARSLGERLFQLGRMSGIEEMGVSGENSEKNIEWARFEANEVIALLAANGSRLDYLERDSE